MISLNEGLEIEEGRQINIVYKNWRGETSTRTILLIRIWYGSTEFHPESQWFMKVFDVDKNVERDFALSGLLRWSEVLR